MKIHDHILSLLSDGFEHERNRHMDDSLTKNDIFDGAGLTRYQDGIELTVKGETYFVRVTKDRKRA